MLYNEEESYLESANDFDITDLSVLGKATYNKPKRAHVHFLFNAKLGEVVNNGIRYFGKQRMVKYVTMATFICPECNEAWECSVKDVVDGKITNCGCKK